MEQQLNVTQTLNDIKRLHVRMTTIWSEKKKYLQSMKKSESYLIQFNKKEENQDRIKLKNKFKNHINKIMKQYLVTIDQLKLISNQAEKELQDLALNMQHKDWTLSQQIKEGVNMVLEIRQIMKKSTQFC